MITAPTNDAFGNITSRQMPAASNYAVGQNPLELFTGRDYTYGVTATPNNQIHAAGLRTRGAPRSGVGAAQGVRRAPRAPGARGIPPEMKASGMR